MDLAHSLKIKYGLPNNPSKKKVIIWTAKTNVNIKNGLDAEESGKLAAQETFSDFETMLYGGQADTILSLLAEAKKR
ncbi:MAG: hypothetical protein KAR05_02455 [Candidatus Omnitrophica bacterium]|nr:hypothetical protein [Candidatus Omnitrophota bacterium]